MTWPAMKTRPVWRLRDGLCKCGRGYAVPHPAGQEDCWYRISDTPLTDGILEDWHSGHADRMSDRDLVKRCHE